MSAGNRKLLMSLLWLPAAAAVFLAWHLGHSTAADAAFYRQLCALTGISQPGETVTLQETAAAARPVPPAPQTNCPLVVALPLDAESCSACFACMTPGPQEMAVILQKLSAAGTTSLALSAPLAWAEEAGDMGRQMLTAAVTRFPQACVGLRTCTAALDEPPPAALAQYAIPAGNIRGRVMALPYANRALPTALADNPDTLPFPWAADWSGQDAYSGVPESKEPRSMPLLMQWGTLVLPTLPLRLAMAHRGLGPQDISVQLGRSITLDTLTLPMDEHGRVPLVGVHAKLLPLTELMAAGSRGPGKAPVVVMQATGTENCTARARLLAESVSRLLDTPAAPPAPPAAAPQGPVLVRQPFPASGGTAFWASLLLCELMCLLAFMPRYLRMPVLGGLLAVLPCAAYHAALRGLYLETTPLLLAWAVLAAACALPRAGK